jgi:hypothetical protein
MRVPLLIVPKVRSPDRDDGEFGYVTNIYTRATYRHRRLGSDSLAAVIEWANRRALEMLIVWPSDRSHSFSVGLASLRRRRCRNGESRGKRNPLAPFSDASPGQVATTPQLRVLNLPPWQGAARAAYDANPRHVQADPDAHELIGGMQARVPDPQHEPSAMVSPRGMSSSPFTALQTSPDGTSAAVPAFIGWNLGNDTE